MTIWAMEIVSAHTCPAVRKQGSALHCVLPLAKTIRGSFFFRGLCVAQDSRNVTLTEGGQWTALELLPLGQGDVWAWEDIFSVFSASTYYFSDLEVQIAGC